MKNTELKHILIAYKSTNIGLQQAHDEILRLFSVVGQSEQLTCPRCNSTNILSPDKDNDAQCIECAFIWAG